MMAPDLIFRAVLAGLAGAAMPPPARRARSGPSDGTGDMFYLVRRDRVAGGLRFSGFDSTIRLDNVQHGLMAIWRIIEAFGPGDYRL